MKLIFMLVSFVRAYAGEEGPKCDFYKPGPGNAGQKILIESVFQTIRIL